MFKVNNLLFVFKFVLVILMSVNSAHSYESFYRNEHFPMSIESSDTFYKDIKPILDKRCVACHSCREAECRLKLTSPEGILRGGNKDQIGGKLLKSIERKKLFHDANTIGEWRKKGFYSILEKPRNIRRKQARSKKGDELGRTSILTASLINKYQDQTVMEDLNLISEKESKCGEGRKSFNNVPGMPYNTSPMNSIEFATLTNWALDKGNIEMPSAETLLMLTTSRAPQIIKKWENFFNKNTEKAKWTSRFLYEHLFLATFYFKESPGEFYELVRSKTASPNKIIVAPTTHATEKPDVDKFYYRLRKIHSTIVDKNHFVYEVSDETLSELKRDFWNTNWGKGNNNVKFNFKNTNPLMAFKHMPAKSRYTWMLKNAHMLLDISARSQNCRSEGASAPYWENMLHLFVKPESDVTVVYGTEYYNKAGKYLPIPALTNGRVNPFRSFKKEQRKYANIKKVYQKKLRPKGLSINDIWTGEGKEDTNAMVTVLKHQWTASAHKGQLGKTPQSVLLVDFASFERYFYLCNVATEVSDAIIGQSRVVTYLFDVKKEVENLFLSLVPVNQRDKIRSVLVDGLDVKKEYINEFSYPYNANSGIKMEENFTYQGFVKSFLAQVYSPKVIGKRSYLYNYTNQTENTIKTKFRDLSEYRGTFAPHLPNVSYIRILKENGEVKYYTMTAFRHFKTRNSLSFVNPNYDKSQRDPNLDFLEIYEDIMVNYPEKIYEVEESDVDEFIASIKSIKSRKGYFILNDKFGIDQNSDKFWPIMDEVNSVYIGQNPIHGGIIDLHRYGSIDKVAPL